MAPFPAFSGWILPAAVAFSLGAVANADPAPSAFQEVAKVLRNPRCLNCHTATDFPRQGDERRRHDMNVLRGPDDRGAVAMRCSSCHQGGNQKNGVPGAPNWGLAPLSMAWEGLDDHDLAKAITDPAKNGHRSLEQLYEHISRDPLVGWAWQPGGDRQPVPMPRVEFARRFRQWIDAGAVPPEAKGKSS